MNTGRATEATVRAIVGNLAPAQSLAGFIYREAAIVGNLASAYTTEGTPYEGDYDVTPTVEGQELRTKNRYMMDDVTIRAIPFYEVSNQTGGNTVYIADEVEME